MKILLVFLLAAVCLATISATPQKQVWEYKFVYQCDEKKANAASSEGWEMVSLSMASYGSLGVGTCAFKRAR